ncbi:DEAD/DEAH box helicase [Candidatus Micrarchaeota archaeon]|nr:DEAD/DEAH box helicase [Candidatus Micrarchaeota archaeon]
MKSTRLVELIKERFADLTDIQKLAIPKILNGENVLIFAPTGSGKSEAVLLPVLEKIQDKKEGIRALYITPLKSLNRDLLKRFNWWCERLTVSHAVRHGDTTQAERTKQRQKPPQIMLTRVETLQALFIGPIMRKHLENIEFVIVDEVHDILDNKRGAQLSMGLERLEELIKVSQNRSFQRIAISATVSNEGEAAKLIFGERPYSIAETGKTRKMEIEIKKIEKQKERVDLIKKLAEEHRTLIFSNTRSTAEELGATLREEKAPVEVHHGSLSKEVRIAAEDKFKSGEIRSLLSTSSLELGIDIGDVDLVIQYSSPHQVFRLIQRVGRSGHSLEKTPKGLIITNDFDDYLEAEAIKIRSEFWMEDKKAERSALDVIAHQLIGVCIDKGEINLMEAHLILLRSYAYGISFTKLKRIALQLYSEGLIFYEEEDEKNIFIKMTSRAREYYCLNLTTIPRERRYLMREISGNRIIASLDEAFVMNLDFGASFLAKGQPWRVIDITEKEVVVEPSSALEVAIPDWTGEDIPVDYEVAQDVGKLRKSEKKVQPLPDNETVIMEIVEDVIIIHACFGTKVNEAIARIFSFKISKLIGESVRAVADPYRILVKLPYRLDEKHLLNAFKEINVVRAELEKSLHNSFLLKFRFTHVGRLFGLLNTDAQIGWRFIEVMRNSIVYEETLRTVFFRYFDVERTEEVFAGLKNGKIKLIVDKRDKPSFFAKLGIEKLGSDEAVGGFEPRKEMISAFKERMLEKTVQLKCISCSSTRFLHIAGAPEKIKCNKCNSESLFTIDEKRTKRTDEEYEAGLIRTYGKKAVISLASYGVGAQTADRILRKLHRDEDSFYWDLIEAQKTFVKNKKYWKI